MRSSKRADSQRYPRTEALSCPLRGVGELPDRRVTYNSALHGELENGAQFEHITIGEKKYTALLISGNIRGALQQQIVRIDRQYFKAVASVNWHFYGSYVGFTYYINKVKCAMYMHEFIMRLTKRKRPSTHPTIDHVNCIRYDNSKDNLQYATQSMQNRNQGSRERVITLPHNCGFTIYNIPRWVQYSKPDGEHCGRFSVELAGIVGISEILWVKVNEKGEARLRAKAGGDISLKLSLAHAISIAERIADTYPQLLGHPDFGFGRRNRVAGVRDYNKFLTEIKTFAKSVIKACKMKYDSSYIPLPMTTTERTQLARIIASEGSNMKRVNLDGDKFSELGVEPIPYCRWVEDKRTGVPNGKFVFMGHPTLTKFTTTSPAGRVRTKQVQTAGSAAVSERKKYNEALEISRCLDRGTLPVERPRGGAARA
jgi:hypothetical protein